MGVRHVLKRGPSKDGELAVLRCKQRSGVSLVMRELGGKEMARTAEVGKIKFLFNSCVRREGLCTKNTSRALIERPYSCAPQAVGAVYD
ncbi:MAG: hypothetical protein DMG15_21885 [Acidobacteria bacterium]|nr:MAG: hypothetical protein DMG15_21885 [Acidobacteriota bacterium]